MKKLLSFLGILTVLIAVLIGGGMGKQFAREFIRGASHADKYYGIIQYTKQSTGVTHIVFQEADSDKDFCAALNSNYLIGIKTSCPDCVIESEYCSTSLPNAYQDIFSDKPMVFPFLSAPHTRIAVLGVPIQQAISICREMAEVWRKGMNQNAKCIINR